MQKEIKFDYYKLILVKDKQKTVIEPRIKLGEDFVSTFNKDNQPEMYYELIKKNGSDKGANKQNKKSKDK